MNETRFQITRFEALDPPTPQGRALLLAAFDLEIDGLRLRNCFLVNRADKGFKVLGPNRNVVFQGRLASDVKNAARTEWMALEHP